MDQMPRRPPVATDVPEGAATGASFWRAQAAIWCLFALADLASRVSMFHSLGVALAVSLVGTPLMLLAAGALHGIYRRSALAGASWLRIAAIIVPASLAGAVAVGLLAAVIRRSIGWTIPDFDLAEAVLGPITFNFAVLIGWSLGFVWVVTEQARRHQLERAARAEADALAAELARLRLQLDPHFLFNALNGVAAEIPEAPETALSMVHDLSGYLRHSLATVDRAIVPVAEEVAGLSAYLDIQRARFGARLAATLRLDPDVADRPIACYLLQPLVENAVHHGRRRPQLVLDVHIRADGADLRITVCNSGTLEARPRSPADSPGGLGLANLRRRLALHYPARHRFSLTEENALVTADLVLVGPPCSAS